MSKISEDDIVFQRMDLVKDIAWKLIEEISSKINDGSWIETHGRMSRGELIDYLKSGLDERCPKEVRFIGNHMIIGMLESVVDEFEIDIWLEDWRWRDIEERLGDEF